MIKLFSHFPTYLEPRREELINRLNEFLEEGESTRLLHYLDPEENTGLMFWVDSSYEDEPDDVELAKHLLSILYGFNYIQLPEGLHHLREDILRILETFIGSRSLIIPGKNPDGAPAGLCYYILRQIGCIYEPDIVEWMVKTTGDWGYVSKSSEVNPKRLHLARHLYDTIS